MRLHEPYCTSYRFDFLFPVRTVIRFPQSHSCLQYDLGQSTGNMGRLSTLSTAHTRDCALAGAMDARPAELNHLLTIGQRGGDEAGYWTGST